MSVEPPAQSLAELARLQASKIESTPLALPTPEQTFEEIRKRAQKNAEEHWKVICADAETLVDKINAELSGTFARVRLEHGSDGTGSGTQPVEFVLERDGVDAPEPRLKFAFGPTGLLKCHPINIDVYKIPGTYFSVRHYGIEKYEEFLRMFLEKAFTNPI